MGSPTRVISKRMEWEDLETGNISTFYSSIDKWKRKWDVGIKKKTLDIKSKFPLKRERKKRMLQKRERKNAATLPCVCVMG